MRLHDTMSPHDTRTVPAARPAAAFDPLTALDDLLSTISLARPAAGGAVSIAGQDPTVPAAHQLGACIGIPVMAAAVAAVAFHRRGDGPGPSGLPGRTYVPTSRCEQAASPSARTPTAPPAADRTRPGAIPAKSTRPHLYPPPAP